MEKFQSQNARYETKSFTKMVTKYLMKFEKEIDRYFLSPRKDGHVRNPFTANAQMLQTETNSRKKLFKL